VTAQQAAPASPAVAGAQPAVSQAPPAAAWPPGAGAPRLQFRLASEGLPAEDRWKSTPVVIDVNRDGRLDLASQVRLGDSPHVWFQNENGSWTPMASGLRLSEDSTPCGGGIEVRDLDRDGQFDLAVADHCKGLWVFLGNGKGEWKVAAQALNPAATKRPELEGSEVNPFLGAEDLAVGDVTGDGKDDIIACAADRGGFTLWVGDGTGRSWKEQGKTGLPSADEPGEGHVDEGGWCREVLLTDMNGDARLDVVASYHRGPRVFLGDGKGTFRSASEGLPAPLLNGILHQVFVADANADGRPDLAVANQVNGPELYLQQPDGSWKHQGDPLPPMRGGAYSVALGDFDGDGKVDLVTGGRMSNKNESRFGIYVLRGNGQGQFTPFATNLPDEKLQVIWGLTVADVNGDGRADVVATIGGAIGQAATGIERKMEKGTIAHVQVWLNEAK
jgi:hypothetical protein